MKLILGLDDTILDTDRFKRDYLFNIFVDHGIPKEIIKDNYQEYNKNNLFNINKFIDHVIKSNKLEDKNIDIDLILLKLKKEIVKCVKPEYINLIKSVGRENVIIVTKGDEEFQDLKIESCGLFEIIDQRYVTRDKKDEIIRDYCLRWSGEDIVFVDDSPANILVENLPDNLRQVFVGKIENLTSDQIQTFRKSNVDFDISSLQKDIASMSELESTPHGRGRMI